MLFYDQVACFLLQIISKNKIANAEPRPLARISYESKWVLAPQMGLNSSIVRIKKTMAELIKMINLFFGLCVTNQESRKS
jgi:hypothetical protein